MLSVHHTMAWDFTHATDPLISRVGQAEAFALANGATVDTTNGVVLTTTQDRARLSCANGGRLLGWQYPYTFITIGSNARGGTTNVMPFGLRTTAADAALMGTRIYANNGNMNLVNGGVGLNAAAVLPNNVTTVCIVEFRPTGNRIWFGATSQWSNTGASYTMPTLLDSDYIQLGATTNLNPDMMVQGFALVPGALALRDRVALAANWRDALFAPAAAGFRSYLSR